MDLNPIAVTFYGGHGPTDVYGPGVTLLDHELGHVSFNKRFFTTPNMTNVFFQAGIPFEETLTGNITSVTGTFGNQMTGRIERYLQKVADWANRVNVDRLPGGKFPDF